MTMATAFAETTKRSASSVEMKKRVLSLYRKFIRDSPTFIELYELDMPTSAMRTKVRQEFERNRFVNSLAVQNVLYMKGQMEYQETINFWKQQAHVMKYFDDEISYNTIKDNGFVQNFLRGTV
ncbi:hypothetical protein DASC09_017870 [Saccharomycopsis crataegensis]|uniref:Uncharacterized protein n=1 Tax=Saccharomycopsis crataegensis TaxID=43959 RepID=A0AAV5QIN6_9ASCO|nr:hypothetical protein DASC09_017870 [Saccharomycopsis crataegensis]